MTDPEELDDLESGLASAFWRRLDAYIDHEWGEKGDAYLAAVKYAMNNVDDEIGRRQLQQVLFAQQEIQKLRQWPKKRLEALKGISDDQPMTMRDRLALLRQESAASGPGRRRGRL